MKNWFRGKSAASIEPPVIDRKAAVESAFQQAEADYRQACRALADYLVVHPDRISLRGDRLFVQVNAMHTQPVERKRLETMRREKLARRNELLAERAEVLQGANRV